MQIEALLDDLEGGDEQSSRRAVVELRGVSDERIVPALIGRFRSTKITPEFRNAIAVSLGDAHRPDAKDALVTAFKDPATEGSRGTLVYALSQYECGDLLPELVNSVISGSYEEAEHAIEILEATEAEIPTSTYRSIQRRLHELSASNDEVPWRREAIRACLDLFDDSDEAASPYPAGLDHLA